MTTTFTAKDLLGAVATFNADPYCVEDMDQANEILDEIICNGVVKMTPADYTVDTIEEYAEMAYQLDYRSGDELPEAIYVTPNCLFAL